MPKLDQRRLCKGIADPRWKESGAGINELDLVIPNKDIRLPGCKELWEKIVRLKCTRSRAAMTRPSQDMPKTNKHGSGRPKPLRNNVKPI